MELEQALETAYAIMGERTPIRTDCGALCGAACCLPDEDGQGGVWLLEPEIRRVEGAAWARIDRQADPVAPLLLCREMCERSLRPLCCRVFPLAPVPGRDGLWTVRMDARARAMCPLTRSGLKGLDTDFVRAARDALRALAQSGAGEEFLRAWHDREDAFRRPLW